jgi:hypothetical protein
MADYPETIICCVDAKMNIGNIEHGWLYSPYKKEYIHVIIRCIRECTLEEYIEFCEKMNFPIRNANHPFYYEVQIFD